mmetsp:Transcript_51747/g.148347  ORF Transcript_51747/g.148347 Transcript_51747/m.148347 type:complete len:113 (+) Transcript_51747:511-849(+)
MPLTEAVVPAPLFAIVPTAAPVGLLFWQKLKTAIKVHLATAYGMAFVSVLLLAMLVLPKVIIGTTGRIARIAVGLVVSVASDAIEQAAIEVVDIVESVVDDRSVPQSGHKRP